MTRRFAEIILLVGFLIAAFALYLSTAEYPKMVQGSTATYVRFLSVWLGLLCLIEMGLWLRKRGREEGKKLNVTSAPFRFWSLLILMFIYSILLEYLGFYIISALFLPVTMMVLGARNIWSVALTSGGVLIFVYLVFAKLLGVPLPQATLF